MLQLDIIACNATRCYFVPYYCGGYHGKEACFTLSDFTTVTVLVLATAEANLKGFFDGPVDAICC